MESSCRQLFDHCQNPVSALLQIRVNLGQRARRLEDVELPIDRDFIADPAFIAVDPGIWRMEQHFTVKAGFHLLMHRHIFGVTLTATRL